MSPVEKILVCIGALSLVVIAACLVGRWLHLGTATCAGCGKPLGPTFVKRADGDFCSVSCADIQDSGWRS